MVALQVNSERQLVILQMQSLPGPSQLAALLKADRPQLALGSAAIGAVLKTARAAGVRSTPVEAVQTLTALQLLLLLFRVCHVVRGSCQRAFIMNLCFLACQRQDFDGIYLGFHTRCAGIS